MISEPDTTIGYEKAANEVLIHMTLNSGNFLIWTPLNNRKCPVYEGLSVFISEVS